MLCLFVGTSSMAAAVASGEESNPEVWTRLERDAPGAVRQAQSGPLGRGHYRLNRVQLEAILSRAPLEGIGSGVVVMLPMPDGGTRRFVISESPVMQDGLARKFPHLRTYAGHAVDDPAQRVRLNLTSRGLHALILGRGPHVFIDPEQSDEHVSYYKGAAARSDEGFECLAEAASSEALPALSATTETAGTGTPLRTARLALAATGEYTQYHGGTRESALTAMVTALNRVNSIYESEVGLRLVLVANNDLLIFTNAAADPYSGSDAQAMMGQNQATVDTLIGNANYDVGHVFSTGGGGLAQIASAGVTGWKALGVTGRASPMGDPFYVDYVAHELGHQFGAHHTFNGTLGNCSLNNRHAGTAYEPGSGSTIMAYAGLCGADNLQLSSDAYFHSASLVEIQTFLAAAGLASQSLGNSPPTVGAGGSRVIPRGTPFLLTAQGVDADGDTLTYCWEQLDLGPAALLSAPDSGCGPLFRSRPPGSGSTRWFPDRGALLSGVTASGELLPQVGRLLNFRVTARDGRSVGMDSAQITVADEAGPFRVNQPADGAVCSISCTVAWDVAGSAQAPVFAGAVDILLSTNGGWDYPIVLATNTPNDGAEVVPLPDAYSEQARVLVRATGNIFFNVSPGDFTLIPHAGPPQYVLVDSVVSNSGALLIPAANTSGNASVYPATIVVDEPTGVIEDVSVVLHGLSHGWAPDLDILLVPPVGSAIVLLSDVGSSAPLVDAELRFSDAGVAIPSGGLSGSGHYLPTNVGSTGDGFPVPEPYAITFSGLKGVSPAGTWSLYVRDDAKGDTGVLAGGWSLKLKVRRTCPPNQAPVLVTDATCFIHEGSLLRVKPQATDPDGDSALLSFDVSATQPDGVVMDSSTGDLSWRPGPGTAGSTNELLIRVTDSGLPALSATSALNAVVMPAVRLHLAPGEEGGVDLVWNSAPGARYQIEAASGLMSGWTPVVEPLEATGFQCSLTGLSVDTACRYFRVRVLE